MDKGINVLGLFDGISCGMVALERDEIPVNRYVAYEIEPNAIKISRKNYPQIEHCGDVTTADFTQYQGFDLLIGGSPCTYWSIARNNRETTPDGIGGQLFMQYYRALKESGCKYFLYENNYSIHQNIKDFISEKLGVQPIMINSALVSAQQRKRCYWTNIPNIIQPKDKKIVLEDILECENDQTKKVCVAQRGRYTKSGNIEQHIEVRGDNKSNCVTTVQKDCMICVPIRVGQIDRGGQENRIYSVRGKSITLIANSGGHGSKTGLYKIDLPDGDYIIRKLTPVEAERLQTLPDNYTSGIPDTKRYKCIGNGWTVDVIAHILKNLKDL